MQLARSCLRLVSALVLLCACWSAALQAHPVPRRCHDRVIRLVISPEALVVHYQLEVDHFTVVLDDLPVFDDKIDLKNLNTSAQLYSAFTDCYAPVLAGNLDARLNGKPLTFTCIKKSYTVTDENKQALDHIRCTFEFRAAWRPLADKPNEVTFVERNYELESGWIRLSLEGPPPIELKAKQVPDAKLQEKPARDLKPGEDQELRRASATFTVPEASLPLLEQPVAQAPASSGQTENGHDLLDLLLDTRRGFVVLMLLAAFLGAVHALTPGHGKTLVAAYLVGERGTVWHALLLGLVTTITHTWSVILLAVVLKLVFPDVEPASVQTGLQLVCGLIITGLGFWLLMCRLGGRADHIHLTGSHHHHHHGDGHHHHHHDHDHGHDHVHDQHGHVQPVGLRSLIVLGITGGIIPCWDAIVLLLWAIMAEKLWLAVPLLLAFSAGLAFVLIAIGIAVVMFKGYAESRLGSNRAFKALPVLSALAVMILGLIMCSHSIRGG